MSDVLHIPEYEDPVFVEPEKQSVSRLRRESLKILFVGNSITRHGVCRELGWEHEAGMAASSEENDYIHLTGRMIGRNVGIYYGNVNRLINAAGTVRNALEVLGEALPLPDLVVLQTGEHEGPRKSAEKVASLYREKLLKPLLAIRENLPVIAVGVWYPTGSEPYPDWVRKIDDTYRNICGEYGIPFASVERYATDPRCRGCGACEPVRWHPNDRGMAGYAREIAALFQKYREQWGI